MLKKKNKEQKHKNIFSRINTKPNLKVKTRKFCLFLQMGDLRRSLIFEDGDQSLRINPGGLIEQSKITVLQNQKIIMCIIWI